MTTVTQPSGEARESVFFSRMRIVFQECSKAAIVPSLEVQRKLAEQFPDDRALLEFTRKALDAARDGNQPFTKELISSVLRAKVKQRLIALRYVVRAVAERFQVEVVDLIRPGGTEYVVFVRQVAMFLTGELSDASPDEINRYLGNRAPSTILSGQAAIRDRLSNDPILQLDVDRIIGELAALFEPPI